MSSGSLGTISPPAADGKYAALAGAAQTVSAPTTFDALTAVSPVTVSGAKLIALPVTNSTGFGDHCLFSLTTGPSNTGFGYNVLYNTSTGSRNCGFGVNSLLNNNGQGINAYGENSLRNVSTGNTNTGVGDNVGYTLTPANATTTGSNQTLIGANSGQSSAVQVNDVVAVGYAALVGGNGAIAIGSGAAATAPGAIAIGHDSAGTAATSATADLAVIGTALTTLQVAKLALSSQPAFVAGDKYLVIGTTGQVHVSSVGPTS